MPDFREPALESSSLRAGEPPAQEKPSLPSAQDFKTASPSPAVSDRYLRTAVSGLPRRSVPVSRTRPEVLGPAGDAPRA